MELAWFRRDTSSPRTKVLGVAIVVSAVLQAPPRRDDRPSLGFPDTMPWLVMCLTNDVVGRRSEQVGRYPIVAASHSIRPSGWYTLAARVPGGPSNGGITGRTRN
jgi:hypothetical protein